MAKGRGKLSKNPSKIMQDIKSGRESVGDKRRLVVDQIIEAADKVYLRNPRPTHMEAVIVAGKHF
jgi:hypothetical protein